MMQFEPVKRLQPHGLHGASLADGPRLWTSSAFGGSVGVACTAGGAYQSLLMSPDVARALAAELLVCVAALEGPSA